MNLHKMIEICLKDDNMHRFVMINALICINNYVITCINSMLSGTHMSTLSMCQPRVCVVRRIKREYDNREQEREREAWCIEREMRVTKRDRNRDERENWEKYRE